MIRSRARVGDAGGGHFEWLVVLDRRARLWGHLTQAQDWEWQHERSAARLRDAAATLRGTLIKACQFASTRPDILPRAYIRAFASLRDHVPAYPWHTIRRALRSELGREPEDVFARIERRPIASASIAQVHRAWLRDGRSVAVKVRYPGIAGIMMSDLAILRHIVREVARFVPDVRLLPILDHLTETLPLELDFRREARAMTELRAALRDREDVLVPGVVAELSTRRLLVMDFVEGIKITDTDALERAGISPTAVARLLNDVYADQIFRRGWLHADPHPGNLLVQAVPGAGPRLVLLDHGLTVPLKPELVAALAEMVAALLAGDFARLNRALTQAGVRLDDELDVTTLLGIVGVLLGGQQDDASTAGATTVGRQLGQSVDHIPTDLILVGRALGLLDGVTKQLDPDLNTLQAIASYVGARETHEAKETGTEDTEAGSPTGGWGPPLGPHRGGRREELTAEDAERTRRTRRGRGGRGEDAEDAEDAERTRRTRRGRGGRGEDAEDAERTRREDGWRRAGVASGPVR